MKTRVSGNCHVRRAPPRHTAGVLLQVPTVRAKLMRLSGRVFQVARLVLLASWGGLSAPAAELTAAGTMPGVTLLTNVGQIRTLSPGEAARKYPIKVKAVVTSYYQDKFGNLFVQDSSGGIHVDLQEQKMTLHVGQLVEAEGVSDPGLFVPNIHVTRLRVIGQGPLPEPAPASFDQLISGQAACQWVEVAGTVRSASVDRDRERMEIDILTGGHRLIARVNDFDRSINYSDQLVDARVHVRGVCATLFNNTRQLLDIRLLVPGMAQIVVDEPAPREPFALPVCPISSLLRFAPGNPPGRRVRVQGVVTYQQPGHALFIRDATQALLIETSQNLPVQPGDCVDVVGFPASGEWTPMLQDAVFRKLNAALPAPPVRLTAAQALAGTNDQDLVQIDATLLERVSYSAEELLVLQSGEFTFNALLKTEPGNAEPALFQNNSRIRATGICQVDAASLHWPEQRLPQTFHLLLRSPADLSILSNPPWLTQAHLMWVLRVMLVILFLGLVWVWILRRQVRQQTKMINQNVRQQAILQERHRMAREIHDTFVQSFAAISLQLESLRNKPPFQGGPLAQPLALTHRLARESLVEARRSIWALHQDSLPEASLPALLAASLKTIAEGTGIRHSFQVKGEFDSLPPDIESNLLYIGREAIINAVKHAKPGQITLELGRDARSVSLQVRDDGLGFDAGNTSAGKAADSGGFGMICMRERAAQIKAALLVQSQPGKGTVIIVNVPLAAS